MYNEPKYLVINIQVNVPFYQHMTTPDITKKC